MKTELNYDELFTQFCEILHSYTPESIIEMMDQIEAENLAFLENYGKNIVSNKAATNSKSLQIPVNNNNTVSPDSNLCLAA